MSHEVHVLHADKHESLLQVDSITFDELGQGCPKYPGKSVMTLWHLKKVVRNEVRDLTVTALHGSNTALTIYYTSNVVLPLTPWLSQLEIHAKYFLHLIFFVT